MARPIPWINRVRLTNFKSIATCDVDLEPLTVLVGPNGSGKSNFLDALAFVAEAVGTTPYQAIESRGGLSEILRRVPQQTDSFGISLDVTVPWGPEPDQWAHGEYGFTVAPRRQPGQRPFEIVSESCVLTWRETREHFLVQRGEVVETSLPYGLQRIEPDRLYLQAASGLPNLAGLFGALRGMEFYNFDMATLRLPQTEMEGPVLGSQGDHLGDVLGELSVTHPETKQRVDEYLAAVAPGIVGVDRRYAGAYVTLEMRQQSGPDGAEVTFGSAAMSDGTVRAVGVLAALFQPWVLQGMTSLVGIEEPEIALHPAAAGALFDALTEASELVQVVATSQSADLLDRDDIDASRVRVVTSEAGLTTIGELDDASRLIVEEHQFTLGELMRGNQLAPKPRPGGSPGPVAA